MSQQQFIPTPKFEEYKERFKQFYKMQRRADGVILVEACTPTMFAIAGSFRACCWHNRGCCPSSPRYCRRN